MVNDSLKLTTCLAAFFLCAGNYSSAQTLTDQFVSDAAAPLIENKLVDGLSIGYLEGDHYGIVHLGSSNSTGQSPDNLTIYELGSLSKVFTGLLLADAVVRGEIDLDAAANVDNAAGIRLPERDGRAIKWIDLSTHRSGLPRLPADYQPASLQNPYRDLDAKTAAAFVNAYELPRTPGESQEYSNLATSLLGYLIAENAGSTYQQLLRDRIARPLRMSDCTVSLTSEQKKRFATPHDRVGSPTLAWTCADLPGAGGVRATMRDMMRFAKAQLSPPSGTLGKAIDLAWKQHVDADASGPAMGLGWAIIGDGETRFHNGQTGGSYTVLFVNRRLNAAIILLCNTAAPTAVDQLATQLTLRIAGLESKVAATGPGPAGAGPAKVSPDKMVIDEALRGRLVGRYQLAPNFIFDVQDRDGHLMVGITNQPAQEVFPDSPTRWSYRGVDAQLEFKLNRNGPARSLVLHQHGLKQTATRIAEDRAGADKSAEQMAIDAKLRRRLVGRYQLAPNFIFDVQDRNGRLMVGITNQPTQEVFPDSATKWSYRGIDATLEFKLNRTGPAKSLVLHQDGIQQTATRIGR